MFKSKTGSDDEEEHVMSNCGAYKPHIPNPNDSKKRPEQCFGICYGPHRITAKNNYDNFNHTCNICTYYWSAPVP